MLEAIPGSNVSAECHKEFAGPRRTILSVAYPLTPVGVDAVGGSEQILTQMDAALTRAGHHSIVIAAEGSQVTGTLIASPAPPSRFTDPVRIWSRGIHRKLIRDVLAQFPVDLVHMHSLDFHCYLPSENVPLLGTLHLPPDWYPADLFKRPRPNLSLNCVSLSQQKRCPKSDCLLPYIPNGVDVTRLQLDIPKASFALALGRICPEKGYHFALDAARRASTELLLAGEVAPYGWHLEYFKREIVPRLDSKRRFIGPIGFVRKRLLLSRAKCLLVPSTVAETSSLVSMEALACGTPVVAFRSGALPEVVEHGRTGFIVSTVRQMAEAIKKIAEISPNTCRDAAAERFSSSRMVQQYFALYERLISTRRSVGAKHALADASWLVNW